MNWAWKSFILQLVSALILALGLSYLICLIIDARQAPGAPDSTSRSMIIGGLLAPIILAALSGWKGWRLKPLLAAGMIVSSFYSGTPVGGFVALLGMATFFFLVRKIREIAFYYSSDEEARPEQEGP